MSEWVSEWKLLSRVRLFATSMDYAIHGILQVRILEWEKIHSPVDRSNPAIEPGSPALQADSLPTELSGKPL